MALYLTSDEIFDQQNDLQFNEFNSRTNFSNLMSKDYFKHPEFNIALKEIYFDPRFPSLADLECPHVITIVTSTENIEIEDFPTKIQELPLFKEMFQKNEWDKEYGQFSAPSVTVNSSTDYQIFIDIDSRFGYAYSISVLRDISFESNIEAVKFLNEYMFPFHKEKPISIDKNGKVSFDSNLDVFMSDNILKLLGFTQHINEYETVIPFAHFPSFFVDEHPYLAPDHEGRVKDRANLYKKYLSSNPKAEIVIEYNLDAVFTNESRKSDSIINVQFDLELFTVNEKISFEYSKIIRKINNILRERFIDDIKIDVVNKILKEMGALEDPRIAQEDIDEITYENGQLVETIISNFLQYLSSIKNENADEFQDDMDDWGGLITLSAKNKQDQGL